MLNVPLNELYWIAGFLEGEGCFARCGGTIVVTVSQVQKEPLERLYKLLGGSPIHQYSHKNPKHNPFYRWQIYGKKAERLMKSVFPIMSPKRQEKIALCLAWYDSRPGNNWIKSGRKFCRKGLHAWIPENIMLAYGKQYCRACKNEWQRNKREEIKKSRISNVVLN
jgi:hypothetical protein